MPFTLTPVVDEDFVGRKDIVEELCKQLSSKNKLGFSVSGIRRIGKTSVLKEVGRKLGVPVVYVSVWRVSPSTVDEFVRVMNRAALAAFDGMLPVSFKLEEALETGKSALRKFLQGLKLSTKVVDDIEVSVSYVRRESDDVDAALTSCFSLIEHMGEMTGKSPVLMLDEFPSLVDLSYGSKNQKVGESVIRLVRTLYEDFKHTKIVISGSNRQTMQNLVARQKAPFYKQLLLREVRPFSEGEYSEFLSKYLPWLRFDKHPDDPTRDFRADLFAVSSGIPYNLQLLGSELEAKSVKKLGKENLAMVVDSVLKNQGEMSFREFLSDLTPSQVKVARALAKHDPDGVKPSEISAKEYISKEAVGYSLNMLVAKGILKHGGKGEYDFVDDLFMEWLKATNDR
nr:ATP-binding protein [Ferrimicrobium acidiphilum]